MKKEEFVKLGIDEELAKKAEAASQGQQVDNSSSSKEMDASDPSNNIRIDAKGVDVTFEVIDGVYSISINGQSSDAGKWFKHQHHQMQQFRK